MTEGENNKDETPRLDYFVNNHYLEISRRPQEEIDEFKQLVLQFMQVTQKLARFLHPDNTSRSIDSFEKLFKFPLDVLTSIVRKINESKEMNK